MKTKTQSKRKAGRPFGSSTIGESVAVNFRLPIDVWEEIKKRAEKKEVPMSELFRAALAEWVLAAKVNRPITSRVAK